MEKIIQYCGETVWVGCDEKCNKAWGHNSRPKIEFDIEDPDDFAFMSDDELEEAPINPGTYEGGQAKPINKDQIPNKWCVRECERCAMVKYGLKLKLPDYSKRVYNQPYKHNIEK